MGMNYQEQITVSFIDELDKIAGYEDRVQSARKSWERSANAAGHQAAKAHPMQAAVGAGASKGNGLLKNLGYVGLGAASLGGAYALHKQQLAKKDRK
jgi:hypothetical protein